MVKAVLYVTAFSSCLIMLFFLMIYLMTTINPPPLDNLIDVIDTEEVSESVTVDVRKAGNSYLHDTTEFILEKVDSEELDFYPSTRGPSRKYNNAENGTGIFRFMHRKAVPPLWPRARETIIVDPTMHVVMPADWPTTSERTDQRAPTRTKVPRDEYFDYNEDMPRPKSRIPLNVTGLNSMKRRSINNAKLLNNSGPITFKILNDKGHSVIEIKLGNDKMKLTGNKISSIDKLNSNTPSDKNNQDSNDNHKKDTIYMTIASNDSIILDEIDTKSFPEGEELDIRNITDLISLMVLVSSRDKNREDITSKQSETNNTTRVPLSDNKMSQNMNIRDKIKSVRHNVANSRNIVHNITVTGTKNNTSNIVAKNSSHYKTVVKNTMTKNNSAIDYKNSTEYDLKYNNTVFMNVLFDDDETNNITSGVTNVNNNTYSTKLHNNTAPSNYTEALSENNNDTMIY